MISIHKVPYCWARNKFSYDQLKGEIRCPGCGEMISNEDVTDTTALQNLVSLIKSRGSRLGPGLWK